MYYLVPEKYLPDYIEDNVPYYHDGTYSTEGRTDTFIFWKVLAEPIVQGHSLVYNDSPSEQSPPMSGVRYVRNIRVRGTTTGTLEIMQELDTNAVYSVKIALIVFRQGISQPTDRDILDVHLHTISAVRNPHAQLPEKFTDEDDWTLCYPGVVKLYSGDFIQLQVLAQPYRSAAPLSTCAVEVTYDSLLDIKFN